MSYIVGHGLLISYQIKYLQTICGLIFLKVHQTIAIVDNVKLTVCIHDAQHAFYQTAACSVAVRQKTTDLANRVRINMFVAVI